MDGAWFNVGLAYMRGVCKRWCAILDARVQQIVQPTDGAPMNRALHERFPNAVCVSLWPHLGPTGEEADWARSLAQLPKLRGLAMEWRGDPPPPAALQNAESYINACAAGASDGLHNLTLHGPLFAGALLPCVRRLTRLDELTMRSHSADATDEQLGSPAAPLGLPPRLTALRLADAIRLGDAELRELGALTSLEFLQVTLSGVDGPPATTEGLLALTGLTQLAVLHVRCPAAADVSAREVGMHAARCWLAGRLSGPKAFLQARHSDGFFEMAFSLDSY